MEITKPSKTPDENFMEIDEPAEEEEEEEEDEEKEEDEDGDVNYTYDNDENITSVAVNFQKKKNQLDQARDRNRNHESGTSVAPSLVSSPSVDSLPPVSRSDTRFVRANNDHNIQFLLQSLWFL